MFYASLAGTPAPTGLYEIAGASISRQQMNTAAGTAFGFLVKSLLTMAIGTAFVQAFWYSLRTSCEGPILKSLDSAFSVLSNILGLLRPKAWRGFVIPMLLAIVAWFVGNASKVWLAANSSKGLSRSPRLSRRPLSPYKRLRCLQPQHILCQYRSWISQAKTLRLPYRVAIEVSASTDPVKP